MGARLAAVGAGDGRLGGISMRTNWNDLSSSEKARVNAVIVLGVLFFVSLVLAFASFMAQKQQAQRLSEYAIASAPASGVVTKRYTEEINGNTWFWDLEASYTAPDGSSHAQGFRVPRAIFDQYPDGAAIPVTYIKADPALFYIPGGELEPHDVPLLGRMGTVEVVAAVLLGLGFAVSIWMARNVGKDETPRGPPGPSASSQTGARNSFGSRNLIR